MYSSSIMRTITLFASVASLFSLPLLASAAPINVLDIYADGSMVERTIDEHEYHASRNRTRYMKERSFEFDEGEVNLERRAKKDYELYCDKVPEVCANICYFQFCKHGSLTQTPKSGRTVSPRCKTPNRCSATKSGYKHTDYQCDEFPMASTNEGGGSNAATRCVPRGQNASAGGSFNPYPKGIPVKTVLFNTHYAPFYCDKNCHRPDDKDGLQE